MNKDLAIQLLKRKDVYLTPEGKRHLEELVKKEAEVTSS